MKRTGRAKKGKGRR